jgi:hypothetical protein
MLEKIGSTRTMMTIIIGADSISGIINEEGRCAEVRVKPDCM